MGRGRAARAWDHTASILAMLANINRDPKKKRSGYAPTEFHPFEQRAKRGTSPASLRRLKGMFQKK